MVKPLVINSLATDNISDAMYDYIYLEDDNKLLKFKVEFYTITLVDAIKKYIENESVYDFKLLKEKEVKTLNTPLELLPFVGKFRLNNDLIKTNNFLVPRFSKLLNFLNEKYEDFIITNSDLNKLSDLKKDSKENQLDIIQKLCSEIQVELVDTYDFSERVGNNIIQSLKKLNINDDFEIVLLKMQWILYCCNSNKKYIKQLGLEQKFIQAIEEYNKKQVQKVKA